MAFDDFEKDLYKNWVRGAKGLEYLQEGLQDFVGDKVLECRDKTLQQIFLKLPAGTPNHCNQCTSDNLLPDHCNKKAACKTNPCLQKNPLNCYGSKPNARRKCPNGICSKVYDVIVQQHSFKGPMWQNTDPTQWCSDPWSYAKCFQTTPNQGSSANTTDAPGLLSVLTNNKELWNSLACSNMGSKQFCSFHRARDIRNAILHSPKQEIDYMMLGHYLNTFITVLQDGKCLKNINGSKTAVDKLLRLQKNQINISQKDEAKFAKMRGDAMTELENSTTDALYKIKTATEEACSNLKNFTTENAKTLELRLSTAITDLHKAVGNINGQINRMFEKQAERKGLKELRTIMQANCGDQEKRKQATDVLFDIVKLIQTGHNFSDEEVKTIICQRIEWYGELTVQLIYDVIDWFKPIVEMPDMRLLSACIGSIRIPIKCYSEDGLLRLMHFMNSEECTYCLSRISSTLSKLLGFSCSITWSLVTASFTDELEKQNTGESTSKTPTLQQHQLMIKHSQMSETKSKEFSLSKQRTKKIEHFKVPLVCWPKLHRAQKLINTLIAYCHDNEEKSEQQESDYYFPSEHVDIFVDDKTFDFACLSIKPEILVQQKTEWYCVSETVIDKMTDSCEGIFVDCNGVKLVRMTSEDTIYADHTYGNENIAADIHQNIHNMIEIVIFTPLLKKVKLLHKLQVEKAEPVNVSQVKEETENLNENKTSSDSTTLLKRKNDSTTDSSRKKKWNIERLLCEMIALIRRSSLPERLLPMIDSFETKELSKQVAQGLFEIDHTIKYCGYRYSTLYIKVELLHGSEKNQRRKDQIEKFLLRNRITDFQLEVIKSQIKEYYQAGTEIQSENERNATLGCFSIYTKGEQRSVCGLLSKHLVLGSSKIFVGDRIHFGTVIPNTNNAGGHDISAAVIVNKHTQYLDLKFKDFEHDTKPAYVLDKSDIKRLQDQPVYLRGARTELGVGTIKLLLKSSDDTEDSEITHLQLSDGSFALGKPDGKLAVKGDSGAIICMDDLDSGKICLLSMLMGEDLQKPDCIEKKYMSLFLSSGLRYLEEKTQGKFSIEETLTDKETEGED